MDALFPIFCLGCEREGVWLCSDCQSAIRPLPLFLCPGCGRMSPGGTTHLRCANATPLSALISPYHYASPVIRGLIKDYKYHGAHDIEKIITASRSPASTNCARFPSRRFGDGHAAAPLPRARRGFNQAATIAAAVSRALQTETISPLKRKKRTEEQARLTPAERRENCRRAFVSAPVTGDIILVDDVVTSGETLAAAASALKAAGARRVFAFALAHGRGDRLKI